MSRKRVVRRAVIAAAVTVAILGGAAPAQAASYWWIYASSTPRAQNAVAQSNVTKYISGNRGSANGGGGWDLTFRLQTVSANAAALYNWGEGPGWTTVSYGFAQLGPNTARSNCLWKSKGSVGGTVGLNCQYYGEPQGQVARASQSPDTEVMAPTQTNTLHASNLSPLLPRYVDPGFASAYTNIQQLDVASFDAKRDAAFWSATDESGMICIIQTVDKMGLYGSACAAAGDFAERGVGLALGGSDPNTSISNAYLFPEPVSDTDVKASRSSKVAASAESIGELVILHGSPDAVTVRGASGKSYEVPGLG